MDKVARIKETIKGGGVDTLPYAFWTHLPEIDLDPVRLAEETYNFYKKYDIDFIKTMNNGMYSVECWGAETDFSNILAGGVAKIINTPIVSVEDWKNIQPASLEHKSLVRELKSLDLLLKKVNGQAPVIFTVFSPLTTADKLSNGKVLEHISQGGGPIIHQALAAIAKTTAQLAEQVIGMGAAGIFFASQMSCYNVTSDEIYSEFGKKYDFEVISAAKNGWFNTLHAHGDNIMFGLLRDYPVDVFNWHVWETLPELQEARDMTGKCLMGGLKRFDITNRNKNAIGSQIYSCIKLLAKKKHILTPGCVLRYPLDEQMLLYVKQTKETIEKTLKQGA